MLTLFHLALLASHSARRKHRRHRRRRRHFGFGNFVVGGNYIVGVVIFLILIAIKYVVINRGAVRISEVTARFTLDTLPGKQMSIDADLNAGLIDEAGARARRKALAAEAEFHGSMDSASRFTQCDAMASILITSINIIAGFLIAVLQHGMDRKPRPADLHHPHHRRRPRHGRSGAYDLGLRRHDRYPRQLGRPPRQPVSHPGLAAYLPLMMAGCVLIVLAALPGMPKLPFEQLLPVVADDSAPAPVTVAAPVPAAAPVPFLSHFTAARLAQPTPSRFSAAELAFMSSISPSPAKEQGA